MARRAVARNGGRSDRLLRSRQAICDACLDLVQEGVLQPSADQVAERAGLSRRSIFNHFEDLAELYDAVVAAGMERYASPTEIPRTLPIAERVARLAGARAAFFEATAPFARALAAQTLVGGAPDQAWRVSRAALDAQRDEVRRLFASDLELLPGPERAELLDALAAAASPANWDYLRNGRSLSAPRARAVLERTLGALLRDAGVAPGQAQLSGA
jgi:AcrR family transcriptional regulator